VASVVGLLSAQIFGFNNRKTLKFAHDLGMAFQLTNIIRDVGEDARRNRIYLPLDELAKFGVSEDDLLASRESIAVKRLLDFQIERAESYYDKALGILPAEDHKNQRVSLMMASIYRTLLREIGASGAGKVLNARISLGALRKMLLALRVWLKY
jgi:phytoene synthase